MEWDEVEREFVIISGQLHKLSLSFAALAKALRDERNHAIREVYKRNPIKLKDVIDAL